MKTLFWFLDSLFGGISFPPTQVLLFLVFALALRVLYKITDFVRTLYENVAKHIVMSSIKHAMIIFAAVVGLVLAFYL